jgi:signal transduction histidine kinase
MRLSRKFQIVVLAVVLLAVVSSGVALVSAWQVAGMMRQATSQYLPAIRAAEEVEIALLEQRELAAFYVKDSDPAWLARLRIKKQEFLEWLALARRMTTGADRLGILDDLGKVYAEYDRARSEAIELQNQGQRAKAEAAVERRVRQLGDRAYDLCERYIDSNTAYIDGETASVHREMGRVTLWVTFCSLLTIVMGIGLLWLFFHSVLLPLRRMVADAREIAVGDRASPTGLPDDEMRTVGLYLSTLMSDVVDARTALEESRQRMVSAEKLASVGKLAASVAHEIRNPLTSMKMWLFSLQKKMGADPGAARKLGIISEEVERLESIVHHFLEFARPPHLKRCVCDLQPLVEGCLELFADQARAKGVATQGPTAQGLPRVMADGEQFRQVLLNLLGNALDATPSGGQIGLEIDAENAADGRQMLVLRVRDTGTGMAAEVRRRIFEPFFTTKDRGTGLGLCIAARIMAEHNGRLVLESTSEQGTTFALWVPVAEAGDHESNSRG